MFLFIVNLVCAIFVILFEYTAVITNHANKQIAEQSTVVMERLEEKLIKP